MSKIESGFVNKKAAKNNANVELSEAITLHRSSRSEILLTPFFIKHSDPTAERDLSIKITRCKISNGISIPEKEINLAEEAARVLMGKLNELFELKKIPDNGNFLLIKLGDGQRVDLSGLEC